MSKAFDKKVEALAALRSAATPLEKRRELLAAFARDAYGPAREVVSRGYYACLLPLQAQA